jgi:hypothetical protein
MESLLNEEENTAALLVLDHAEHLLSMHPGGDIKNSRSSDVSLLAQLLLLPQTLGLTLTTVVISNNGILEHTGA